MMPIAAAAATCCAELRHVDAASAASRDTRYASTAELTRQRMR